MNIGTMATFTTRPVVMGTCGVVTAGHYLASAAGMKILQSGGNAVDAAAAMGFCLPLLEPSMNGIGGEVPILIYSEQDRQVFAISGQGVAPKAATIEWFRENDYSLIPGDGFLPACVPAIVDAWTIALQRFGTMTMAQVMTPAVELAERGFPMYEALHDAIASNEKRFRELYPTTATVYLPNGCVPKIGDVFRNPDWASTLRKLIFAENANLHKGRVDALEAARDVFYKGEVAESISDFAAATEVLDAEGGTHSALMKYNDLASYHGHIEEPVTTNYRGIDVFKCPPWCQGPVFLQQLNLLEGYDLRAMGHNSAEYVHTVMECAKLAFSDREAYYGDPLFDDVPLDVLLSKTYADERRGLVNSDTASPDLRPGEVEGHTIPDITHPTAAGGEASMHAHDTTHLDAADAAGNMVSATPSGGWFQSSPVIAGLGFSLGTRGQMFYLDSSRPNALAPGKRPRATLTPSLALKDGKPFMVFGTPGGDQQDQWTLQFFLNYVEFGMDIQEAIDMPTFHSEHFPSSFYPRTHYPKRVVVENRVESDLLDELRRRGHDVVITDGWANGRVLGIRYDSERGVMMGGASPRSKMAYAIGW